MKVGIFYIGVARYSVFWKDFYLSSEKYFLPGIDKQYFVFTDNDDEITSSLSNCEKILGGDNYTSQANNVTIYHQESFGSWVKNVLYRYKMILGHQEDYADCDYLYFFNANTLFRKKVTPKEFIPQKKDNYLIALSPDFYIGHHKDSWPYERRPESCACIPYGKGDYYYQSAIYGGRKQEYLELLRTCDEWVRKDEEKDIVACIGDESHFNKYLLDKRVKVVGSKYGKGEDVGFYWYCKIILRDKYKVLGDYYMEVKPGYKPEKFSFKRYSLKRFLRKIIKRILLKYRNARF
ncbi:MAG: hypothetical protein LBG96_18200 [Tannerella sp.]|jgi:hypothetical protein|nr:hypothetical protein [Tannerella sp.]